MYSWSNYQLFEKSEKIILIVFTTLEYILTEMRLVDLLKSELNKKYWKRKQLEILVLQNYIFDQIGSFFVQNVCSICVLKTKKQKSEG